jgi:hypothetical protein
MKGFFRIWAENRALSLLSIVRILPGTIHVDIVISVLKMVGRIIVVGLLVKSKIIIGLVAVNWSCLTAER